LQLREVDCVAVELPADAAPGEAVALLDAGAHALDQIGSHLSRGLPATYMVRGDTAYLIRAGGSLAIPVAGDVPLFACGADSGAAVDA